MRPHQRLSQKSPQGQRELLPAGKLRAAPQGSAKGILIAVVLFCLLIAGGVGIWLHGRGAKSLPSTAAKTDPAASVADMTPEQRQQSYQDEVNALQARGTDMQSFLASFPKPLTDLDALAQSVTTPQAALQYVRDQIALEPYPGVLKGALGTLLTRGGNDLDRALLLGTLLKQQNIDFKIAHGTISGAQAQTLLQQVTAAPDAIDQIASTLPKATSPTPGGDNSEDQKAFQDAVIRRRKELNDTVEQTSQQLQSALKTAGITLGQDATAQRLEVLEDHYWVQASIDGKSVDLDPSPATAQLGQSLCTATETLDAGNLPDNLYQRLKFRVVTEHLQSGQVQSTEVLSQEVKSVDLLGKNIRLAVEPQSASANVNHFRPVLAIGDDSTTGQPFSLRPDSGGSSATSPEGAQSSDTGAVGGAQGGLGGLGIGGLAGGGGQPAPAQAKPQPASAASVSGVGEPVLARLFLEVVSTGPHLAEVHYRRVLMDRLDSSGGKKQLLATLADDRSIRPLLIIVWDGAIAVGPFHPVYVFQTQAAALAAQEPLDEKIRAKVYLGGTIGDGDVPAPSLSPNLLNYFLSSDLARHGFRVQAAPDGRSFYERPRLAFFRHGFAVGDWSKPGEPVHYLEGLDLINSPFGFLGPTDKTSVLAMKAGVADTFLERYFCVDLATSNTLPLVAAAANQGVPLLTLPPGNPGGNAFPDVPPPLQSVLRQDIKSGHALLAPARLVTMNGAGQFGWWSIDPATGFSLGRMDLGGSQGMVETAEMNEKIAEWTKTYVTFYGALMKCYLGAMGDALSSSGGAGSPLPSSDQVSDCVVKAACDAIADLVAEEVSGAAAEGEVEEIEDMIAKAAMAKGAGKAVKKGGGKVCEGAMNSALGK